MVKKHRSKKIPKNLRFVLEDGSRLSITKPEVKFHEAHSYERAGDVDRARKLYTQLLEADDTSPRVKATINRRLGWLTYNPKDKSATPQQQSEAEQLLNKAVEVEPDNSKNYFCLGRCYAGQGKVHEAFEAYRMSIDKSEGSANTWCSIGTLYQLQSQPMDALQAYICAVQLDKTQDKAWANLGVLYENCSQFSDALACFINAVKYNPSMGTKLTPRIKMIEETLKNIPASALQKRTQTLPSLENSFSLPIPAELTSRQVQPNNASRQGGRGGAMASRPDAKKRKTEEASSGPASQQQAASARAGPPVTFTGEDWRVMTSLQQQAAQGRLSPADQLVLQQLSNKFQLHQQQQQQGQQTPQPQQQGGGARTSQTTSGHASPHPVISREEKERDEDFAKAVELLKQVLEPNQQQMLIEEASKMEGSEEVKKEEEESAEAVIGESSLKTPFRLSLNMTASEILKDCKEGLSHSDIISEITKPPYPRMPPYEKLADDQYYPPTPCIYLENRRDANSVELQEYCLTKPVVVIRGLASVLKLDLGLFSTKTLADQAPEHKVEIRTQRFMDSTENKDERGQEAWAYRSDRKFTSVAQYAKYQSETFVQSLKEEQSKAKEAGAAKATTAEADSPSRRAPRIKAKNFEFGTNVDLSDPVAWRQQLHELKKLPTFLRVTAACNMLSHVGYTVMGMNSVQLYMKVPGSRTPGHQENINYCSANINIGPGDVEWFSTPEEYWGFFHQKCEEHNLSFLTGSWWPILEELREANVPVFRFIQKPGDLVFINAGTVHWVQALGWCNNIAWNIGPLTSRQFELNVERYEWNKLMKTKSIVPMVHLSWNLARNLKMTDQDLFQRIKYALMRSLKQVQQTLDLMESMKKPVTLHERTADEPAYYCETCDVEVFNVLLCRSSGAHHKVFCLHCALKKEPALDSFIVLQQHSLKELMHVYDAFQLGQLTPPAGPPALPGAASSAESATPSPALLGPPGSSTPSSGSAPS